MGRNATLSKFNPKLIERQVAVPRHTLTNPLVRVGELAATASAHSGHIRPVIPI